ncbi:MAG: helix-turn-helix domain-containing protein [Niabella sp.]
MKGKYTMAIRIDKLLKFCSPHTAEMKWSRKRLAKTHPLYIPGAYCYTLYGDWGNIIFQHIPGKHFDIWISHYDICTPCTIYVTGNIEVIECCFEVTNEKIHYIKPLHPILCGELTCNLYYFSRIEAHVPFKGDQPITTLDIHCPPLLLKKLHKNFPDKIAPVLEAIQSSSNQGKNNKGLNKIISAQVFGEPQPCQPVLKENLAALIRLLQEKGAKADVRDFVYTLLHVFLAQDEHVGIPPPKGIVTDVATICERMREVFPKRYTGAELAKMALMTRRTLYRAFKTQLHTSPRQYYHKLAMETAFHLIKTTTRDITAIALDTGFSSKTSFSRAFQNHFGIPSSQIRKNWHTR